ncbi:MAG: hypothetical protein ABSF37_04615 [Sedimentisphaerales bacterium]|jgi:hypothetical protein
MEYKFKQIKLSPAEKLWLTEILKFNFSKVDVKLLRVNLWEKLPKDFDPDKMDYWLLCDNHLTLIGLWHVDPQNALFGHTTKIAEIIKDLIRKNPSINEVTSDEIAVLAGITEREAEIALTLLCDLGKFFGGSSRPSTDYGCKQAYFSQNDHHAYDKFMNYKNLEEEMEQYYVRCAFPLRGKNTRKDRSMFQQNTTASFLQPVTQDTWDNIYDDFGISKRTFTKKINFITDEYKRMIIFRDIEQSYILVKNNFYKPATLLAGGVIEELLRLYLESKGSKPSKNNFENYIIACDNNLRSATSCLSDSVRHFRNLVHLEREESSKDTISKTAAFGAVSAIFTIANDFKNIEAQNGRP